MHDDQLELESQGDLVVKCTHLVIEMVIKSHQIASFSQPRNAKCVNLYVAKGSEEEWLAYQFPAPLGKDIIDQLAQCAAGSPSKNTFNVVSRGNMFCFKLTYHDVLDEDLLTLECWPEASYQAGEAR